MLKNKKAEPSVGSAHEIASCNGHQILGIRQVMRQLSNRHVGEVMQLIETIGLGTEREQAFKAIVKRLMWLSLEDELACLRWSCPDGFKEYEDLNLGNSPLALP